MQVRSNLPVVVLVVHWLACSSHGFVSRPVQTEEYKIGICCFSVKQAALRRKSKDYMVGLESG